MNCVPVELRDNLKLLFNPTPSLRLDAHQFSKVNIILRIFLFYIIPTAESWYHGILGYLGSKTGFAEIFQGFGKKFRSF